MTARAYSHGCMRVQNPDEYAEVLLGVSQPEDHYTAARIRSMYGTSERTINFKHPIPVYITYQTAFADDAGKAQARSRHLRPRPRPAEHPARRPPQFGHPDRAELQLQQQASHVVRREHSTQQTIPLCQQSRLHDLGIERLYELELKLQHMGLRSPQRFATGGTDQSLVARLAR